MACFIIVAVTLQTKFLSTVASDSLKQMIFLETTGKRNTCRRITFLRETSFVAI